MLTDKEICCNAMKIRIRGERSKPSVYYDEETRRYSLIEGKNLDCMFYCPWCGEKLPERLDPWDTILEEYGEDYVKYPGDEGYKELPPELMQEFKSDLWWKKRGL